MARGRAFLKQANLSRLEQADAPQCPLCIEVLDSHEQGWYPCPCGYQVCAFCYERLQLENNKQCPGCRTVYGASQTDEDHPGKHYQASPRLDQLPLANELTSTSGEDHGKEGSLDEQTPESPQTLQNPSNSQEHPSDLETQNSQAAPTWRPRNDTETYTNKGDESKASMSALRAQIQAASQRPASWQSHVQSPETAASDTQMGASREIAGDGDEALQTNGETSPQSDIWEKLLSMPRPKLSQQGSELRQKVSQAVSSGGLSPEEGAQKLVAYLQGISLNGNTAQSSPQDFRPSHSQSQPSTGSTPSPSKPLGVNQGQGKQGSGTLAGPDSLLGTVQSDMEVPAPRKRMTGEEKLRSWLTNGVQVPPPPRGQPAVAVNGFSNNPAVAAPSRKARYGAHGIIGESIGPPQGAQNSAGSSSQVHTSSGPDNLWGPLSKQSSSSSFWGGHPLESDPVPESVQELWADKTRSESRFSFKPGSQETERRRDSFEASSFGGDGSAASSLGRQPNGLLSHNSLSSTFPTLHNMGYLPQDHELGGQGFRAANSYTGQQVGPSGGPGNQNNLSMSSLNNPSAQNQASQNYLQGIVNRSGTPVGNQSVSPSYNKGFGQAGLAASQGQAFPSPLGSKPLAPPGLSGRLGTGIGNPVAGQLGATGLANHLPRTAGLNSQFKSPGMFNLPASQPAASRFQNQLGQGVPGLQGRQANGLGGYGDGRSQLTGPPGFGPGPGPSTTAQQPLGAGNGMLDFAQLKQRQMIQELQNQQLLRQKSQPQQFSQQQVAQSAQAQLLMERREQLRQLMQQGLLDLTPQQLQQLQAQQILLNQQQKGLQQQQNLWPSRNGSPGVNPGGVLNPNAGHRLFQR